MIKSILRKLAPKAALAKYHRVRARIAGVRAGLPARKLLVIGVTGTKGKSTTVAMIAHCLAALDERVAFSSTVQWGMLGNTWPNRSKMTMPGDGALQMFLQKAVRAGCTTVVLEVSSEGLAHGRHLGITFDAAVFLNLTPEHIESHGSFRKYREAKERLFASLNRSWRKTVEGKKVPTVIAANLDDANAFSFLRHAADVHVGFTQGGSGIRAIPELPVVEATNISCTPAQCAFTVDAMQCIVPLLGAFNVQNALATIAVLGGLGYDRAKVIEALANFSGVPGRMEEVQLQAPFRIFVDYASLGFKAVVLPDG